jgi:hypothetical protein
MISLSFNQMFYYFLVGWQRYGGEDGLQILPKLTIFGAPLLSRVAFYIASVAILAACVAIVQTIRVSRFGQIIRAISQNERRVVALGLYPLPYKLATFVIPAFLPASPAFCLRRVSNLSAHRICRGSSPANWWSWLFSVEPRCPGDRWPARRLIWDSSCCCCRLPTIGNSAWVARW